MGRKRNAYEVLVEKTEGEGTIGRLRSMGEVNI
jgi:hypothetical protein